MPKKKSDIHKLIQMAWYADKIRLSTAHGKLRSVQRLIGTTEIRDVILYGFREEEADTNKGTHWTYSLRNKDVDGSDIRIIFDVEGYPDVIIVTLMHVFP